MTDKTELELIREALDVQNACNLSGVVHSFARVLADLRKVIESNGRCADTSTIANHPVSILYSSKIASLTECEYGDRFHAAYVIATELTS